MKHQNNKPTLRTSMRLVFKTDDVKRLNLKSVEPVEVFSTKRVEPPVESPLATARPWWRTCTIDYFKERIRAMSEEDLTLLAGEINAEVVSCGGNMQAFQHEQAHPQRHRALRALTHMKERKSLLGGEIQARKVTGRKERFDQIRVLLDEAEKALDENDVKAALYLMVKAIRANLP